MRRGPTDISIRVILPGNQLGSTALVDAASNGHSVLAKKLLKDNCDWFPNDGKPGIPCRSTIRCFRHCSAEFASTICLQVQWGLAAVEQVRLTKGLLSSIRRP